MGVFEEILTNPELQIIEGDLQTLVAERWAIRFKLETGMISQEEADVELKRLDQRQIEIEQNPDYSRWVTAVREAAERLGGVGTE